MSKSLQKGILFAVCILLVCALGVTLFIFDGTGGAVTGQEGQASGAAEAAANSYEHGSNIGRTVSSDARPVTDESTFLDALAKNQDIDLQADLKLKTPKQNEDWRIDLASSQAFRASTANGTYTGTLFGNGHTISYEGIQDTTNRIASYLYDGRTFEDWDLGGIVNSLSGEIYDLNVVMTGGSAAFMAEGHNSLHVGGIVGYMYGSATIDNCTFTKNGDGRLASGMESSPGWGTGTKYAAVGGIVGRIATSGTPTITNCTVNWNGGSLEAGIYDGSGICNGSHGMAGLVVGVCYDVNASINKIIVNGSGTIKAAYAGNIGCTGSSGLSITVPYYLNNFNGQYSVGGSANSAWHSQSGSGSVTNRILGPNTNDTSSNPKIQSDSGFNVYFDPYYSSDDTNFLAIEFTGVTYSPSQYEYSLTSGNGSSQSGKFSASASNNVLVRNLPATPSTWNSDGNIFDATLNSELLFNPSSYAKLTKYDHGYVDPDNRTTNGTAIGTGEAFEAVFSPSGTITSGVNYHLTNDIVITGFTGKEFSATLDGNGHTIFITGANTCAAQHIGGIVGTLTGTIKNVRVVLVNSVTANTSVSNANVGLVAGHINGGSLINVSVDIPTNVTLSHVGTANDSSLGGIAGSAVSGATFTNVTMNFNGTLSNTRNNDYWPYTSAFVGKPYFKDSANSSANCATFNNIIIRGNGTFASQSNSTTEPPYYAAIGIIQHKGVTDSTAAVYNVNGLIYDFNPQFANDQGATTGNHGACYGLFVNNNNNNATQVQYYDRLVNYGSNGVYNASGAVIEAYAFNENGNAPVPNPSKIKNITETVTNVTGSAVKAYFMPGDSASENLTLVASASNWNGVTQLQLDGAAPAVTSADDGSNKVVNVAKSTAVNISGENLTLSPYNPYTVITASLVTDTKVYDGDPFEAQVSFDLDGGDLSLTEGQYTITYTDGKATGETNANVGDGTYSLTVTLTGTASDGTQYVFDAQGTKTKTFTYTITPLEVTGTWSVNGLKITYGDAAPDYDQYISIELTNEGTIPGGLTGVTANGFTANYVQGTTQAGNTVTISGVDFDITEGNGIIANNYTLNITAGTETTVEVQKREITISAAADLEPDAAGHIVVTYGGENYVNSQDSLAALLTWAEIGGYVNGRYDTDEIGFTITAVAHEGDTEAPGTVVDSGEWAKLPANDRYYITVESTNSNYTVAQGNYFTYYIAPAELTIDSVVWSGTNNNTTIYNGSAQTFTVNESGLVEGDNLEDVISTSVTYNNAAHSGDIINAGTYTITVNLAQESSNYDPLFDVENTYDLTISPITLTPTDISGTFTEYTSSNLPTGASFVTSGILESDSEVTVAVTSWVNDPSTNVVGSYVAVNTYTANLEIQDDTNGNYELAETTAEFEITAYNLENATITVEASGLVYDGTEKTATVTVKAGEADITDLVTITGNKATNAGDSYTVSISSKDSNTTGSKNADTTWSIARADYNMEGVTFEDGSITYDGESHTLTISEDSLPTGEDGIKVTVEYTAVNGGEVNITNVGSVDIKATFATTSTNYNTPAAQTATLTIEKANYDMTGVTFEDDSITYDGASHTLTISEDSLPTGEDGIKVTVKYTAANGDVNITNVGSIQITANFTTTSTNYNTPAAKTATLTIEKKAVTIEWSMGDIIQGTDPDKVKATAEVTNNGGILDGDEYTFTVTLPLKDGSGDYTTTTPEGTVISVTPSLKFTDPTDEGNYDITYNPEFREWTVQLPEVKISVTEDPVDKTYAAGFVTEADFLSNFTGTFTETSLPAVISADNFDITITKQGESEPTPVGVGRLDVGTYTVTISAAADSQYTIADGSTLIYTYTVTAEQWTATVAAPGDGLTYNGLDQLRLLVITPGTNNTCDGAPTIAAVVTTGGEMKNAGTYTVTLQLQTAEGAAYEGGNFVLTADSAQIEIAKLKVEIEWEANGDLVYNGQAHTLTATITNKVETDNVTAIVEKHSGDNINVAEGGFAFTIIGLENNDLDNYTIDGAENLISQAFNIIPATLTVEGKEGATLSREYDGNTTAANSFLTADLLTVTGNAPSDDIYAMLNATVAAEKTILNADTYTVTITFNAQAVGASNYDGAEINVALTYTVNRKVITVTFGDYENLTYTASAHQITATVTDSINNDVTDLTGLVAISGTGTSALNAGNYTATVSKTAVEGEYSNYTLASDATQEFTIAQATLTLTEKDGATLSREYDGTTTDASSFVSDAYVTVDGFVDADGNVYDLLTATVADGETIKNADTYTITFALTNADGNYALAAFDGLTYTINPKTLTERSFVWTDPEDYTYDGSEIAPTAAWAAGAIVSGDSVDIAVTISAKDGSEITDNQAINAGDYTATIAANSISGNYKLAADVTYDFTIARKAVTITWTDGASDNFTYTYDGTAKAPTASVTEGAPEGTFDNINTLVTIDGIADNQAINAGSYTATITKVEFETAYPNYTIAEGSGERQFTIDPATISVSLSASGDNVENNTITLNVSGRVTASAFTSGEATLTEGENTVTITAAAADGANLPDIFFTLNGEPYLGTHYGTKVEGGELSVATANTNYKITVTQPLTLNITPSIVVQVNEGAPRTATYGVSESYKTDYFTSYFSVVDNAGSPVTGGSGEVTITNEEGGSVVQIKNAGTYTITYTYTPADWSGSDEDKPSTSYTFTITPATVTSVVLAEGEPSTYTFGDLRTDSTISVTVTYSDSTTQTLNATFETVSASGNYVSAGQEVTLTLTGDDNENANYMSIGEGGLPQHQVEIRVEKRGITASISYMGAQMVGNILTIEYAGDEVQANISVTLNGMIVGVETSAVVTTQIGNASTYKPELFLEGRYANNYTITNTGDLSVVVTPKEITVNWGDTTEFTYNGSAQAPVPTATGTFDNDTVNLGNRVTVTERGGSGSVTPINAGAYTATVAAFEQGNYKLSAASEQPFSIAKATATLGIENYQGSVEYNGSAVTVTPTVNGAAASEGIVNVTIAYTAADGTEAVSADEIRNAGSYTVTLQISGALNYADASEEFVITVTPAELTVTTANTSFTYGDNIDLGASVTTLGDDVVTVAIESVTVDNEAAELKNVGTYTVTYKLEGEDSGNYSIAEGRSVTVTITAKELNIIWSEETFTYNGSAQAPTFEVNWVQGDELELTAAITGNVTDGEAINAGDYIATIAAFEEGNYTLKEASTKTFTIGKADLTLDPASVTFSEKDAGSLAAYSEDSYEATIKDKVTVTGVVGKIADYTVTTEATFTEGLLGVGAHTFTITAGDNYNTATFTVTVKEQQMITITATPSSGTYTGSEITFEYAPSDSSVDISGLTITVATVNGSADGAVLNAGSYTVTFTVSNSDDADYLYVVSDWKGTIAAAEVTVTEATLSAIYGEVYTAEATGVAVQNVNGWSVATFNGTPVQATVAIDQTAAAAALPGETIYLSASETAYNVIITLTSDNFKFADTVSVSGNSKQMATTLTVEKKELDVTTPTDLTNLTYTSEGVVIEIADISEDIVGSDNVTVTIMVDGESYEPGVTVLSAGEHTITYAISGNGNYAISANSAVGQTFTIAPKAASDSITVSGETVESGGTVEITTGENLRVDTAINNYIAQNGVAEGEYTVTATDSQGNEVDIDRVSSWAPGDYTISVNLGENFSGGEMTFTISVAAGTTTEIPDPPTTPSTPIVDDGGSGNNWLFPLIIAIECVIALALIAAIVITAIKRSKNA